VEGHYATDVDTYLAIASRRDERRYEPETLPGETVTRILDAGRLAGSGSNRQPWTFVVVEDRERVEELARCVYAPQNVLGAGLVVAIVVSGKGPVSFDAGRAAQNMLLAAWNEGVSSCPNGLADREAARAVLGLAEGETPAIVLTFGVPQRRRDPESRTAADWSARANRRPLDDVVRRLD
jgi:nitroreductase